MAAPKLQQVYQQAVVLLEATNNYMNPSKANVLLNMASDELFNTLLGSIWQYRFKSPDTPISSQVTSAIGMLLGPFWKKSSLSFENELWLFPPGTERFAQLVDIRLSFTSGTVGTVMVLDNPQFRDREVSNSQPPTEREAIAEYSGLGFNIKPRPLSAEMIYYQQPTRILIPFVEGEPDFETIPDIAWGERAIPFLTMLVIRNFGIPINNPALIQVSEQLSKLII